MQDAQEPSEDTTSSKDSTPGCCGVVATGALVVLLIGVVVMAGIAVYVRKVAQPAEVEERAQQLEELEERLEAVAEALPSLEEMERQGVKNCPAEFEDEADLADDAIRASYEHFEALGAAAAPAADVDDGGSEVYDHLDVDDFVDPVHMDIFVGRRDRTPDFEDWYDSKSVIEASICWLGFFGIIRCRLTDGPSARRLQNSRYAIVHLPRRIVEPRVYEVETGIVESEFGFDSGEYLGWVIVVDMDEPSKHCYSPVFAENSLTVDYYHDRFYPNKEDVEEGVEANLLRRTRRAMGEAIFRVVTGRAGSPVSPDEHYRDEQRRESFQGFVLDEQEYDSAIARGEVDAEAKDALYERSAADIQDSAREDEVFFGPLLVETTINTAEFDTMMDLAEAYPLGPLFDYDVSQGQPVIVRWSDGARFGFHEYEGILTFDRRVEPHSYDTVEVLTPDVVPGCEQRLGMPGGGCMSGWGNPFVK